MGLPALVIIDYYINFQLIYPSFLSGRTFDICNNILFPRKCRSKPYSRRIPLENIAKKATFQETKDRDDTNGFERTNGLNVRQRVDYKEYPAVFKEIQGIYPGTKTILYSYT